MVTRKTVKLWSEKEQAQVDFDLDYVEEIDDLGGKRDVLLAKRGEEEHRISPNATDEDLRKMERDTYLEKVGTPFD